MVTKTCQGRRCPSRSTPDLGWDRGFRSTGLAFNDQDTFSVRFSRPGTYAYACLIHPKMVGTLVVQG